MLMIALVLVVVNDGLIFYKSLAFDVLCLRLPFLNLITELLLADELPPVSPPLSSLFSILILINEREW